MNLFELFVKIGVDDQASGKLKDLGSKLGNGLKTAAKIGTAAVGAAATAITALTTAAVNNYAEYEQLVGGAQLMFGKAYDTVAKNAQDAYKTVQMSQNEYLQQVNGFATGLKTALGGNEQAAAELADRIITAEADIIAATGNTAENVQNAFNGIMKSNFTMLDNLQIGITPTKEGFQEVIDKVNEWNKENGKATDYQMGNLADMQSALVDYIEMQGYAGYASREAANTISGSLASAKSAWTNLLTGLADENADVGELVNNLVTTIVGDGTENNLGVLGNIMPAVKTALKGASKLVSELLPKIVEEVPAIINDNLPILAEAAISIIQALVDGISENQESLFDTAFGVITYVANSLLSLLPKIGEIGLDLIMSLVDGISKSVPELIPAAVNVITELVNTFTNPETLSEIQKTAATLIESLSDGLLSDESINGIIDALFALIENMVDFMTNPESIMTMVNTSVKLVVALANGLLKAADRFAEKGGELIQKLITKFKETDWGKLGRDIVNGVWNGIKQIWGNLVSWFTKKWDGLVGGVKDLLGIHSPSRVFAGIGKNMALGVGEGWEDEFGNIQNDIDKSLAFENPSMSINASVRKVGAGAASGAFGGTSIGNITINIDGAKYSDEQSLALAVAQEIQNLTDRRSAVYA